MSTRKNRIISIIMTLVMTLSLMLAFASCGSQPSADPKADDTAKDADTTAPAKPEEKKFTAGPITADDENWTIMGAKYRSSQTLVKPDMTDKFEYAITDSGEISVKSLPGGGYNPTAVVQSKKTIALTDVDVEFRSDEGFTYTKEAGGYASMLSFAWCNAPLTDIPEYLDGVGTNGLRAMIPSGAYAVVVSLMGANTADNIADFLYIIMFDGTDPVPETDHRVGYRWAISLGTDVSKPVTVSVKEDEELGYVVVFNNVEFREGERMGETLPIDLTALKGHTDAGYISVGAECASNAEGTGSNFIFSRIGSYPAGAFFN